MTVSAASSIAARLRGRRNRAIGLGAEQSVINALRQVGIDCDKLETGWRVKRVGKKIVGATPLAKVLADIVGVQRATGRAVLIEVKYEDAPTLAWGRLEDHQITALDRWNKAGAWCAVAYVRGLQCRLITWRQPADIWGPGLGFPWDHPHASPLYPAHRTTRKETP